jgi:hypothetical protein
MNPKYQSMVQLVQFENTTLFLFSVSQPSRGWMMHHLCANVRIVAAMRFDWLIHSSNQKIPSPIAKMCLFCLFQLVNVLIFKRRKEETMALNPDASVFTPNFAPKPDSIRAADVEGDEVDNDDEMMDKSKKRKRDKNKNKNGDISGEKKLTHSLGMACKHNQPDNGLAAYREAKEQGVQMKPEMFNMLITLLSGLSNHIRVREETAPMTPAHSDAGTGTCFVMCACVCV